MASWSLGSSSLDPSLIAGDIQCVLLLGAEAATKAGYCMGTSESPKQSTLVPIALFASLSRPWHLATRAMGTRMNEKLLQARRGVTILPGGGGTRYIPGWGGAARPLIP